MIRWQHVRAVLLFLVACQSGAASDRKVSTLSPQEMMTLCDQQEERHAAYTRDERDKIYCSQRAYAAVTGNETVDQMRGICERAFNACVKSPPPEVANAGKFKCRDLAWVKNMFTCGAATVEETELCWQEQDLHARRIVPLDPCNEFHADGKDAAYARYLARYEGARCAALDKICGK